MTTTLAGLPVLSLALTIPLRGAWSASVALEGEASLSGDVALVIEGRTWTGRVHRGGNELGRWQGQLVGAGAILAELDPQAFQGSTLREVFVETLRAAGLSASADTGDLSALANHWHRLSGPASRTLAAVADAAGYGWRVLADGTVWTGPETWAAQALAGTPVDVLDVDPAMGRYQLAGDAALDLLPGRTVTLDGASVRVGLIEHHQVGAALRTIAWAERTADAGGAGRLRAAIREIVRAEVRDLTYALWRPCTVVSQSGDLLDLRPDDDHVAPPTGVPYRTLPGVKLTIPAGTRVLLGYEGADPRRPVALLAEYSAVTRLAVNGATTKAARDGEAVNSSTAMDTWITAVSTLLNTPGVVTGSVGAVTPPPGAIGAVSGGSDVLRIP